MFAAINVITTYTTMNLLMESKSESEMNNVADSTAKDVMHFYIICAGAEYIVRGKNSMVVDTRLIIV